MIHPVVQPDEGTVEWLLNLFNSELAADGFQIVETTRISGRPIAVGAASTLVVFLFETHYSDQKVNGEA